MIDKSQIIEFVKQGLEEDVRDGDHTSNACIPEGSRSKAKLLVKDIGVLAGVDLAKIIFEYVDPSAEFVQHIPDGKDVDFGSI